MANLFDPTKVSSPEGFSPNVDNTTRKPVASIAAKIIFWVFGIILLFAAPIYFFAKRNSLIREQTEINQAASTIETQLAKRADTLIKVSNLIRSYKEHEQSLFSDIARLRSMRNSGGQIANSSELNELTNNVFSRMALTFENYPELKASELYKEGMEQSIYLEREIAAARRVYNSKVTNFNSSILTWPTTVISSTLGLSTYPLFQATATQRADVDMSKI